METLGLQKGKSYYVTLNQRDVDIDRVSTPEATLLKHALVPQAKVTENWLLFHHLGFCYHLVSFNWLSCPFTRNWLCFPAAGCRSDLLV